MAAADGSSDHSVTTRVMAGGAGHADDPGGATARLAAVPTGPPSVSTGRSRRSGREAIVAFAALLLAVALVAAACSTDATGREARGRSPLNPPDPASLTPTVESVNHFTTDLYRAYGAQSRGNFSLSPYVVAFTLGMVRAGAGGQTRQEIDSALHEDGSADLDRGFATLAQELAARDGDRRSDTNKGRVDIMAPSALWGPKDTNFSDPFLNNLSANYDSAMHIVDMRTDADAARTTINNWARDATSGVVTQLLPRGAVSDDASLLDVSAFSLQAPWATPFRPARAGSDPFTPDGGSTVVARTIGASLPTGGRFAEGSGWQAVELPYLGNELSMLLVIPDAGTFATFESGFDGDRLASIVDQLRTTPLDVQLPRFQFQTDARLDQALQTLGIRSVFDDHQADLSGISADASLTLSGITQQAYIDVNQNGTGTQTGSITVAPTDQTPSAAAVRVTVDRPFLVLVRDDATSLVLSIGRVVSPSS
jgi:serpin B